VKRVVTSPINAMRELLSVTESIPRLAEMETIAKEIGYKWGDPMTFDQAVQIGLAGKRATVDFSAMGRAGKVFNQMVPFFNANIQGSRSFVRAFRDNPTKAALMAFQRSPPQR
jgi:pyruvate-formate lyase